MKFFVDVGKPRGAGGGLSQLNAQDALIVARQLRLAGVQDVYICHVKTGARVTENDLEAALVKQHDRAALPFFPAEARSGQPWIS